MNLKISRGEEARKLLVRYGATLKQFNEAEEISKKYDEDNPFSGGGAYSDAGWESNPTRRQNWALVAQKRAQVEIFEKEIKTLSLVLLQDAITSEPAPAQLGHEDYLIKYPFEIPSSIVDNFVSVLEGVTPGRLNAVQMKFENPLIIANLTRKLFNQDKTEKGRVFGYAVVCPQKDPQSTVIISDETTIQEEILALLPIGPNAQKNAVMFSLAANASSLFLEKYIHCRAELDRRDRLDAKKLTEVSPYLEGKGIYNGKEQASAEQEDQTQQRNPQNPAPETTE